MNRLSLSDRLAIIAMWMRNSRRLIRALRDERHGLLWRRQQLEALLGRPVSLNPPTSVGEKTLWRMLHDRDPVLVEWSDKVAMRGYIRRVVGDRVATAHLPPLVWQGTRASAIPFHRFDRPVLIKANNASGRNILWDPRDPPDRAETVATCRDWLRHPGGITGFVWIYNRIRPRILVEEHIGGPDMADVIEIKFFVFGDRIGLCVVTSLTRAQKAFFDADFNRLDIQLHGYAGPYQPMPDFVQPSFWNEICGLAIALTNGKDMLRVDLMVANDFWWFGELTPFSSGGRIRYLPDTFDRHLSGMWILPTRHLK